MVLERQTVGHGETGYSSAHLTARPDLPVVELIERYGEETARHVLQGSTQAIRYIEETCVLEGTAKTLRLQVFGRMFQGGHRSERKTNVLILDDQRSGTQTETLPARQWNSAQP